MSQVGKKPRWRTFCPNINLNIISNHIYWLSLDIKQSEQHWKKRIIEIFFFSYLLNVFNWRLITLQYCSGFCHPLTWISHGCTSVQHPEASSHVPPHPIPLVHPSAPALKTLSHASNLDWRSVSHMIICLLQCYSVKSSHPHLLPQSPKDCSIHIHLFC